ncbi:hypothetical protein OsJ_13770 [Oryza sativa Japonica Group]|uniref:Uncharacterized protein n=1 Tax=Oryza sativa subsp. japonica TaxID=39947 RepID=A3AQW8_ORYSJ|nr:hypothetical protein OsJ_13770 [Oryza sativa Japonica Group]
MAQVRAVWGGGEAMARSASASAARAIGPGGFLVPGPVEAAAARARGEELGALGQMTATADDLPALVDEKNGVGRWIGNRSPRRFHEGRRGGGIDGLGLRSRGGDLARSMTGPAGGNGLGESGAQPGEPNLGPRARTRGGGGRQRPGDALGAGAAARERSGAGGRAGG